jgi:translation elongation factor EF-G
LLRGMTELDLETVCYELKKKYPDLQLGAPTVEYIEAGELLEPYYSATVDTPEDVIGEVMGDLSSRRGLIVNVSDCATGKTIVAEVPVAECFGYSTVLRRLTHGRGHYNLKLIDYRPAPYYRDGGDPTNVA